MRRRNFHTRPSEIGKIKIVEKSVLSPLFTYYREEEIPKNKGTAIHEEYHSLP